MKKKKKFPIDYKIVYKYKGIKRDRYITAFSAKLALNQFDKMMADTAVFEIKIYKWDMYIRGKGAWIDVTDQTEAG